MKILAVIYILFSLNVVHADTGDGFNPDDSYQDCMDQSQRESLLGNEDQQYLSDRCTGSTASGYSEQLTDEGSLRGYCDSMGGCDEIRQELSGYSQGSYGVAEVSNVSSTRSQTRKPASSGGSTYGDLLRGGR